MANVVREEVSLYALESQDGDIYKEVGEDNRQTLVHIRDFLNRHTCEHNPVCEALRGVAGLAWDSEKMGGEHVCPHKNHMVCDALRAVEGWQWSDPAMEDFQRVAVAEQAWMDSGMDLNRLGYSDSA
jgi:hypothetical protein